MPAENILAIDNGTQSIRAILFDPKGNLIAKERIPIEPYFSTAPGLAELDGLGVWRSVQETISSVSVKCSGDPIRAISFTSLGESVDEETGER